MWLREVVYVRMVAKTPSPLQYSLPSTLTKESKTFGEAREKFRKVFLRTGWTFNSSTPGPGAYIFSDGLGKSSLKYTMRQRTKCEPCRTNTPGPAKYGVMPCISPLGKFFLGGLRNSGAPKFGPLKRFAELSTQRYDG
eukprot:TRINITY_DN9591_c0_g1_i19.p1 TRINITY_DN9591_c0_g1~~TRINITY_DN9591_c0_g1_i19.p1  ORF type:complete len:138 (+),score=30.42 TRINITY_DN9591_c0_g1_i19:353-766(+)